MNYFQISIYLWRINIMSMQKFNCPHCGHLIGPVAVNDKVKTAVNHMICSNCKTLFLARDLWTNKNNEIIIREDMYRPDSMSRKHIFIKQRELINCVTSSLLTSKLLKVT